MKFIYIAIAYLTLDILWITSMTPILYKTAFEKIQKTVLQLNILYAFLAYFVLLGVIYFICRPLSQCKLYASMPWLAYAIVGFSIYAVFNLTNAAVFTNYPKNMILIDTLWGTGIFALLGVMDNYFD